jgi:hypothetical protein
MNKLKHVLSPADSRITDYQQLIKERDAIISRIQLENLALKGSLRESAKLIQSCIALLGNHGIPIPLGVANFLGQNPHLPPKHLRQVSASLTPLEMQEAYRFRPETTSQGEE